LFRLSTKLYQVFFGNRCFFIFSIPSTPYLNSFNSCKKGRKSLTPDCPIKEKRPTSDGKALNQSAQSHCLTGRQLALPDVNTCQTIEPLEVQLVVNLYRKRKKAITFFLDTPGTQQEPPRAFRNKNILAEAVEYSNYLKENPSYTHAMIAQHFYTQRERVSRLLSLVRRLPSDFVEQAVHLPDTELIGNDVFDIARIKNHQKQRAVIEKLFNDRSHKFSTPNL